MKDLRVIDRDLKNVLLIDNVSSFIYRLHIAIASSLTTEYQ